MKTVGKLPLKLLATLFLVVFFIQVSFRGSTAVEVATPTPTPPAEVNSFELFWPMVAGRTVEDPLFLLKRLKENLRGWIIFSPSKKADYSVFLVTKRVLEAEKLINQSRKDASQKTLTLAQGELSAGDKNLTKALESKEVSGDVRSSMVNRLNNLETFLKWFIPKSGEEYKNSLEDLLGKIQSMTGKL